MYFVKLVLIVFFWIEIECKNQRSQENPFLFKNEILNRFFQEGFELDNSNEMATDLLANVFGHQQSQKVKPFSQLSSVMSSLNALNNLASSFSSHDSASQRSPGQPNLSNDPDTKRTSQELILSRGFFYEDHYVTTKDGYILHLFRIINPYIEEASGASNLLHPVLLQHGLFATSSIWMLNSFGESIVPWIEGEKPSVTGNSLAFLLANLGYDVWLANNRGNIYSQNHTTLDPKDDKFWDFTLDDIAMKDTSAVINYIRYLVDKKITVIGHSFGTTQVLGLLSFAPYNFYYIDLFIALGPIGYFGNVKDPLGAVLDNSIANDIIELYHGKFPPELDSSLESIFTLACEHPSLKVICGAGFDLIGGMNTKKINQSRIFTYYNNIDYTSIKTVKHLFQAKKSNIWHLFDYDEETNYALYGYSEPPKYPYSDIDFDKFVLVSGLNDRIADTDDVQQLRKKLEGKILIDYIVKDKKWNHFDYVYGIDAYGQVNKFIVDTIDKHADFS